MGQFGETSTRKVSGEDGGGWAWGPAPDGRVCSAQALGPSAHGFQPAAQPDQPPRLSLGPPASTQTSTSRRKCSLGRRSGSGMVGGSQANDWGSSCLCSEGVQGRGCGETSRGRPGLWGSLPEPEGQALQHRTGARGELQLQHQLQAEGMLSLGASEAVTPESRPAILAVRP